MRAIEAKTFSGYDGLRLTELPKPQPVKDRSAGPRHGRWRHAWPRIHDPVGWTTLEPSRRQLLGNEGAGVI